MKLKKVISLALATAMVVSMFSGCTKKAAPDTSTSTEQSTNTDGTQESIKTTGEKEAPTEISIAKWNIEDTLRNGKDDKILMAIQEGANVLIKPVNTTWDDYRDKIQLWASSNQLPDMFAIDVIGSNFYHDWISQGVVSPLPEDLSKWPTLEKYMSSPDIQALRAPDGKMYVVPRVMWSELIDGCTERRTYYRWDLAQAAGVTKEPETYDEFRDMIKKIVDADPEGKKVTGLTVSVPQLFDSFFMPYGVPLGMGDGSGSDFKWIEKDGKYVPAYFSGDLKSVFQLARDMYVEGTVDPDIALAKGQLSEDKFLQGKVAAYFLNTGTDMLQNKWEKANPDKKFEDCVKITKPFPMKDGSMITVPVFKTYWSETYIGTKEPKKIEKILDLMEWTLANDKLIRFGFEGEDYVVENGIIKATGDIPLYEKYPANDMQSLVQYASWYSLELIGNDKIDKYRQWDIDYLDWVKKNCTLPEFDPAITNLSTPTKNQFVIKPADDIIKVMTGKEFVDKMYDDLMAKYEKMGLQQMIEEVNAAMK